MASVRASRHERHREAKIVTSKEHGEGTGNEMRVPLKNATHVGSNRTMRYVPTYLLFIGWNLRLVFRPGGMNSWFLYEVTVFSMGPFSAKIAYYLGKSITAVTIMVLGSGITAPFGIRRWGARRYRCAHRRSGISYDMMWCVFFFFC